MPYASPAPERCNERFCQNSPEIKIALINTVVQVEKKLFKIKRFTGEYKNLTIRNNLNL
jgi:hypothetical protein